MVVFSSSFDDHINKLKAVFQRFGESGLKIKPSKCFIAFAKRSVKCLGHLVSEKDIETDPGKIKAAKDYSTPQNVND